MRSFRFVATLSARICAFDFSTGNACGCGVGGTGNGVVGAVITTGIVGPAGAGEIIGVGEIMGVGWICGSPGDEISVLMLFIVCAASSITRICFAFASS